MAPRDAASRAHNSSLKQQLELELLLEFLSMALALEIARKWLFELIAIAIVSEYFEKMERADVKHTFLVV